MALTTLEDIVTSATFFWTALIAIQMFYAPSNNKLVRIFVIFGWGLPSLLSLLALILDFIFTKSSAIVPYA
jgi:hypothetical protein